MAGILWRWVLGGEVGLAGLAAAALALALSWTAGTAVCAALALFFFLQVVPTATSFVVTKLVLTSDGCVARNAAQSLRAFLTELWRFSATMIAVGTAPLMSPRDVEAPPHSGPARPVLLLHGLVCNRAIWRGWLERLQAAGFGPIRALTVEPLFADIEASSASVERELRDLQHQAGGAPVAIVAHSLGGLIARAALRGLGPGVIGRIVTIGSPHHGTLLARHLDCPPLRQMSPDSQWLRMLNASQEGRLTVPFTSIYSLDDNLVTPAHSAALRGARLHEMRGVGHVGLLRSPQTFDLVLASLK